MTKNKEQNVDDKLISLEKMDRISPEMWPEKIPGLNDFIMNTPINNSPPAWTKGLTNDDISSIQQLGALSNTGLIAEIKKLYDQAYQLGVQESKEMTHGKYLNVFANSSAAARKKQPKN